MNILFIRPESIGDSIVSVSHFFLLQFGHIQKKRKENRSFEQKQNSHSCLLNWTMDNSTLKNYFRAIFMIPTKPPPTFRDSDRWSPQFIDFVSRCLVKTPESRATASELLHSDFISTCLYIPTYVTSFLGL